MFLVAVVVAAAVSAAGSSTGAGTPPDGTYNYSITQGGSAIGNSTVTIKRTPDNIALHETETLGQLNYVVDETLDANTLNPKTYVATYTKGTGSQTARVAFDRTGATVTFDGIAGNEFFALPAGVKNAYVLESSIMTGFLMLPAQLHASRANQFLQVMPSEVAQLTGRVSGATAGPRPASLPSNDVSLSIGGRVSFDEWYDPNTYILHAVSVPIEDVLIQLTK